MKTLNLFVFLLFTLVLTISVPAQNTSVTSIKPIETSSVVVVLASHRATIVSELSTLKTNFTATHPSVISKKSELEITQREMAKILALPKAQQLLLSDAYGKLIVRRITAEAALADSLRQYTLSHPQVVKEANLLQAIEKELSRVL